MKICRWVKFIGAAMLILALPAGLLAATLDHTFPKLANLFFRWHINADEAPSLARWDLLIVDMEVQNYSPEVLREIRRLNPKIKILAYLACQEIRADSGALDGTLRQKLYKKIDAHWWLKNYSGQVAQYWPGNNLINVSAVAPSVDGATFVKVLPRFLRDEVLSSGLWDGVFYDNVWQDVSFLQNKNLDINNDGRADDISYINEKWRAGMIALMSETRDVLGTDALVVGNGGEKFYQYLNGALYEHFPDKGWAETLKKYKFANDNSYAPALGIINSNVNNSGRRDDYRTMRFGLTSALLVDGYYSFDNGDQSHSEIWWYDEYEVYLGKAAGAAKNLVAAGAEFAPGLWRRDYQNGLVLVNSLTQSRRVDLGGEYEKIKGAQDAQWNSGAIVEQLDLSAQDGVLLLRPLDKLLGARYYNGAFVRIFNRFGNRARTGFFAYNEKFRGGSQVWEQDWNNDGRSEWLAAQGAAMEIYDAAGVLQKRFYPYGEKFGGGINFAVGDLDGNGTQEIVVSPVRGGPQILIYNFDGKKLTPGFFAFDKNFRGGVRVAVADLERDGKAEIIVGAGAGGGPQVRMFNKDGRLVNPGFFAYDKNWRTGVNVSAADVDGDGYADIITGPGAGGPPLVRLFDKNGKQKLQFYAYAESARQGVEVGAADIDADGRSEIVAGSRDVFTLAGFSSE